MQKGDIMKKKIFFILALTIIASTVAAGISPSIHLGKIEDQFCWENGETENYALAIYYDIPFGISTADDFAIVIITPPIRCSGWSWDESILSNGGIHFHGSGFDTKLKLIPNPDASGSCKVSIRVTDGFTQDIKTFTLTVYPDPNNTQNQPPVFDQKLPDITLNPCEEFKEPLTEWLGRVVDPDTPDDLLTFEVLENGHVTHTFIEDTCAFTAPCDWNGTDTLKVVVTDDGGGTDTTALLVHVLNPAGPEAKNGESVSVGSNKAVQFALAQNYPNPFNPSTTIEFSLPEMAHVTLTVYNMLGNEVARLVDGERSAGMYSVLWDASDVSAGIYFYRIQAGNQTIVRKCILTK